MKQTYGFAEDFPQWAFFIGKPSAPDVRRYVLVCEFPKETLRGTLLVWVDMSPSMLRRKEREWVKIAKKELEITMNHKLREAGL